MLKRRIKIFVKIFFVICFLLKAKGSDSLSFFKWISLKYSFMPFMHVNEVYEITNSNSQSILFEFGIKQSNHVYSVCSGVQNYILNLRMPNYSKVSHDKFELIEYNNRNILYSILGEMNLHLRFWGIPISMSYYRSFKNISLGISTGITFYRSFEYKNLGMIIRYPDTLSYHFVGIYLNNRFSRTHTEFKLRYNMLKNVSIDFYIDVNLINFLHPLEKNDFIDRYYNQPPRQSPSSWFIPTPTNNNIKNHVDYYNIELQLNRIPQINFSLKINIKI